MSSRVQAQVLELAKEKQTNTSPTELSLQTNAMVFISRLLNVSLQRNTPKQVFMLIHLTKLVHELNYIVNALDIPFLLSNLDIFYFSLAPYETG